jgi:hypothetical protein
MEQVLHEMLIVITTDEILNQILKDKNSGKIPPPRPKNA